MSFLIKYTLYISWIKNSLFWFRSEVISVFLAQNLYEAHISPNGARWIVLKIFNRYKITWQSIYNRWMNWLHWKDDFPMGLDIIRANNLKPLHTLNRIGEYVALKNFDRYQISWRSIYNSWMDRLHWKDDFSMGLDIIRGNYCVFWSDTLRPLVAD